jgi:hypothetical protein
MNLRDCLETISDLLQFQRCEEQEDAARLFRQLIAEGAPAEIAAQAMVDSHHFERRDVLRAVEAVLGRDSEEARQILTEGRFTSIHRDGKCLTRRQANTDSRHANLPTSAGAYLD